MEEKVVICSTDSVVNMYLKEGWSVKSVTSQRVATYNASYHKVEGGFCFVLERQKLR